MNWRARIAVGCLAAASVAISLSAHADPQVVERAKQLLASGKAKEAYSELQPLEAKMAGMPEFDYLLGVAALDSGKIDEAVIAFERVLAVIPNHAGAQMDLARAYYAAGSFDLAEAAFKKLRDANPPPAAQQAITRYLDLIQSRRNQARGGWTGYGELGLGWDSNLTGVPTDFGAAAQQSFNLVGIQATGNSIKRSAGYVNGGIGAEYTKPLSGGWSLFAGGELRGRAYKDETLFNAVGGDARLGAMLNRDRNQWRFAANYFEFNQEGDAPGDPKPTNDHRMGGGLVDWRHTLDPRTQVGASFQYNAVRFPTNNVEDFDQAYLALSYLKSFERAGVPLWYLTAFATNDKAKNKLADGVTDKSKRLGGLRSYFQYSLAPKLQVYNVLGGIVRRDVDSFARSTTVEKGRDVYGEFTLGLLWQFREKCTLRLQYAYTQNSSNIDIYDYNRSEVSSLIRCDMF